MIHPITDHSNAIQSNHRIPEIMSTYQVSTLVSDVTPIIQMEKVIAQNADPNAEIILTTFDPAPDCRVTARIETDECDKTSTAVWCEISTTMVNISIYLELTKHLDAIQEIVDQRNLMEPLALPEELVREIRFQERRGEFRSLNVYTRDHLVADDDVFVTINWHQLVTVFRCAIECYEMYLAEETE